MAIRQYLFERSEAHDPLIPPPAETAAERRLHPWSWVFTLWAEVRKFAVPVLLVVAAARFTFFDLFWRFRSSCPW